MRPRDLVHGLSLTALIALLAIAAPAAIAAAPPPAPAGSVRLSDERTSTLWATPIVAAPIRPQPNLHAIPLGSLRLLTEDGYPEVYLLLRSWTAADDRSWLQIRVPVRRGVRIGWVESSALAQPQIARTQLVVNRRRQRATLHRSGHRVWRSPIGVGKPRTPTPRGRFWIRERIRSQDPDGPYGPLAFGTSAYSRLSDWPGGGVIGIHGTNQPKLIPGRPSHGCIRVPNRAIRRLARLMPIGTPVWIR